MILIILDQKDNDIDNKLARWHSDHLTWHTINDKINHCLLVRK